MPRYRNTSGQVLISMELGVIGPGECAPAHYDPEVHGVIPGCTREDDNPPGDSDSADDAGDSPPGDDTKPKGRRRSAAGQETGE